MRDEVRVRAEVLESRRSALQVEVKRLDDEIRGINQELREIEQTCYHEWEEPQCHRKHHEGYRIPRSCAGSDFQPAMDVPSYTEVWYTRVCMRCGKLERSYHMKPAGQVPAF